MKKYMLISLIIIILSGFLYSETIDKNSGEFGFQFLKLNYSPAFSSQAGTGALFNQTASVVLQDPAAALNYKSSNVHFSQLRLNHFDADLYALAWRSSGLNRSIGVSFVTLDYGKFEERLENGTLTGEYYPLDLALSVNYAQRFADNHLVGLTAKGLYEKIHTESSIGAAFDLGYIYLTPIKNLSILSNVKNIGFADKMKEEKIDIPYTFEIGTAYTRDLSANVKANTEFKALYHQDDEDFKANFGAQVSLYEMLHLRAGYKFNHDNEDITAGIGISYKQFEIDYSYVPVKIDDQGDIHHIGLSVHY